MLRLGLEIGRKFNFAQSRHEVWTAWMKATTRRRVDEAWRLARRYFLERIGIICIRVGGRGKQGMSVGMQGILQQPPRFRFFDQVAGTHYKNSPRKIFDGGKVMRDVNY